MNEKAQSTHRTSVLFKRPPSMSSIRAHPISSPQHGNPEHRKAPSPTPEEKRKKKRGFAKIWSIVTGSSLKPKSEHSHSKSVDFKAMGGNQVYGITDDDYPLAPPPPLSYLVDRDGGGNRSRRHSSTPCLPGTVGQNPNQFLPQSPSQQGYNGVSTSPPTAPSSVLPSPVSLRMPPAVNDTLILVAPGYSEQENDAQQQQLMIEQNFIPPSNPGIPLPQRPHTFFLSRDKTLPPLPPNENPGVGFPPASDIAGANRPQTMYASMDGPRHAVPPMATLTENFGGISEDPNMFSPPQVAFRDDIRRQSFEGMERPRIIGPNPFDTPRGTRQNGTYPHANGNGASFNAYHTYHGSGYGVGGDAYGEFGNSRTSLGWLEDVQKSQRPPSQTRSYKGRMGSVETTGTGTRSKTPSKRKSRFGLASMFGKKKDETSGGEDGEGDSVVYSMPSSEVHQFPPSDGRTSVGRMSDTSRKAIQQLVEQDSEFVAYRYPSNDVLQQR